MLNFTNHQRLADQTHNVLPPPAMTIIFKKPKINVISMLVIGTHMCCGKDVKYNIHCRKQYKSSSKT